jgi:hypothetical protein
MHMLNNTDLHPAHPIELLLDLPIDEFDDLGTEPGVLGLLAGNTIEARSGDRVPPTHHGSSRLADMELHDDEEDRRVDVAAEDHGPTPQNGSTT